MKTKKKIKQFSPYDVKLDKEEQELLESYEKDEWESVGNLAKEKKFAREIAHIPCVNGQE